MIAGRKVELIRRTWRATPPWREQDPGADRQLSKVPVMIGPSRDNEGFPRSTAIFATRKWPSFHHHLGDGRLDLKTFSGTWVLLPGYGTR